MTIELFRDDAYLKQCEALIVDINDRGGIILDQTVFYPTGGGQPGDSGVFETSTGSIQIATTVKDKETGHVVHVPAENQPAPQVNEKVSVKIDWERRYKHMRMHTALHLLCSTVPCGVTGGQINETKGRLDFDIGEFTLDKEKITEKLNQLIKEAHEVTFSWISDEELEQNPDLVRTMSVQPPRGSGKVRLIKVGENIDLQPCGGTHINNTSEIGAVKVAKIENKGKRNRRVNIVFD
ncbi:alanyl-tRNA editing protein [Aliikangiella coralliicola]|uniref:Alanine--tRNA ligase n=1 Tax=Aliikangiella coralliicola TaxID=2592383 RepID=A0A545UFY9_9GAMM|nr:alanyl-tRNA editing protein [Aliikangiella coralliicola]TQV88391.1 alanyl-tRNA editing protein [Aliikangiella coralliicola]